MHLSPRTLGVLAAAVLVSNVCVCRAGATLDALGLYLTNNGYGGAQLRHPENFYHLPIQSNGKTGDLVIDTGSPTTLIFRSSLNKLNLAEFKTRIPVKGAFGRGREVYGLTMLKALSTGNCVLTNVPAEVAPGGIVSPFGHETSNGLLGVREMTRFSAVLDLHNRLIYLRPSRPNPAVVAGTRSILLRHGYTPVALSTDYFRLRIAGAVNGISCYFLIDTGAYVTGLDYDFAERTKIQVIPTRLRAEGLGGSSRTGMAILSSLRIANYELKRASTSVVHYDPGLIGRGTRFEVAGLLGVDYLAKNSAIFDFVTGTMYLRRRSR